MPGVRSFLSANAETSKAKVQIVYYDKEGGIIRIDDSGALGYSGTWKEFTLTSHAPADAATMEIRLTTEDAQGASVLFDGIRLKVPGLEGKYDFTGKKQDEGTGDDEGTGLTYFGARFYDPESCRFTTADTYTNLPEDERVLKDIEKIDDIIKQGLDKPIEQNRYVYCANNPTGRVDPDGHFPPAAALAVFAVPGAGQAALVAAVVTVAFVVTVAVVHDVVVNSKTQSKSNPFTGAPGSTSKTHDDTGDVKQERTYGNDGYPDTDTDHDHDHGQGKPHTHKWGRPEDGSPPTHKDRGPGESKGSSNKSNSKGNSGGKGSDDSSGNK